MDYKSESLRKSKSVVTAIRRLSGSRDQNDNFDCLSPELNFSPEAPQPPPPPPPRPQYIDTVAKDWKPPPPPPRAAMKPEESSNNADLPLKSKPPPPPPRSTNSVIPVNESPPVSVLNASASSNISCDEEFKKYKKQYDMMSKMFSKEKAEETVRRTMTMDGRSHSDIVSFLTSASQEADGLAASISFNKPLPESSAGRPQPAKSALGALFATDNIETNTNNDTGKVKLRFSVNSL